MPSWLSKLTRYFPRRDSSKLRMVTDPHLLGLQRKCQAVNPQRVLKQTIAATRFVVIDTETTGLQAYSGDEIVSVAALEFRGLQPTGSEFVSLVNPGRGIPAVSTAVHGITDRDVVDAPSIDELLAGLLEFIGDAVLVGHHIGFDIRFLNKTLHRVLGCRLKNPWLDTMLLYLGHSGRIGHYSLEDVAAYCKVPLLGRHSARGDAQITAMVFSRLAAQLAAPHHNVSRLVEQQGSDGY